MKTIEEVLEGLHFRKRSLQEMIKCLLHDRDSFHGYIQEQETRLDEIESLIIFVEGKNEGN